MSTAQEKLLSFTGPDSFGGPASVSVLVDSGQFGERGTQFFLSSGNPNDQGVPVLYPYKDKNNDFIPADPKLYDTCIDLLPTSPTYLDFYQYRTENGITAWYDKVALTPASFPAKIPFVFTVGVGLPIVDLEFPIPDDLFALIDAGATVAIGQGQQFDAVSFVNSILELNYQINIEDVNPTATTIGYSNPNMPIEINLETKKAKLNLAVGGAEFVGGSNPLTQWVPISGTKTVHLIVSIILK
jgi:hypothetical protein